MSRSVKNGRVLFGALLGVGATIALVIGGVFAGAGTAASAAVPQNTSPPTITGTPQQGQALTGHRGTWTGHKISFSYQWVRCGPAGQNCGNIVGATSQIHALTSSDVGFTIRVTVTATNPDGFRFATSAQTALIAAASSGAPQNTSAPTILGVPQEGQKLTGNRGLWSGNPTDYNYFWTRCDKTGGSCSNISGANAATYTLASTDVGNTLRFKVQARNASGSTFASSVPTAVIVAATKPPPTPAPSSNGCPGGSGPIPVADLSSPALLLIDQQQANPSVVRRGQQQLILRYHVSACGGRSVQGALVYATAVPFGQLSIPPEQPTGQDGFAELDFRMLSGFPVSSKQQLIAVFVRARKSGENLLGGISSRRLFSVPVNLHG